MVVLWACRVWLVLVAVSSVLQDIRCGWREQSDTCGGGWGASAGPLDKRRPKKADANQTDDVTLDVTDDVTDDEKLKFRRLSRRQKTDDDDKDGAEKKIKQKKKAAESGRDDPDDKTGGGREEKNGTRPGTVEKMSAKQLAVYWEAELWGEGEPRVGDTDRISVFHDSRSCKDVVAALTRARGRVYARGEALRVGPGEQGAAVTLTPQEAAAAEGPRRRRGYCTVSNDKMAADRALPDYRNPECVSLAPPAGLHAASVVMTIRNEQHSVLLRTLHSVINRTPRGLVKEILLVDDASDEKADVAGLVGAVQAAWPEGVVALLRVTGPPVGAVRGRVLGALRALRARARTVVFLTSGVEVTKGWLEPLLARLQAVPEAVVYPVQDYIDPWTLQYTPGFPFSRGAWTWGLDTIFLTATPPPEGAFDATKPISSPALIGAVFAVGRDHFLQTGGLDVTLSDLRLAEVELAFRTWMCGGRVEVLPCSRVGIMMRHPVPDPDLSLGNVTAAERAVQDASTVAATWLGDYMYHFRLARPASQEAAELSRDQKRYYRMLKTRLQCKDFKWFLENVDPDKFMWGQNVTAWGQLRNVGLGQCVDALGHSEQAETQQQLAACGTPDTVPGQLWALDIKGRIRTEYRCLGYLTSNPGYSVIAQPHCDTPERRWHYKQDTNEIVHEATEMCLDVNQVADKAFLSVTQCTRSPSQTWHWQHGTIRRHGNEEL